LYVTLTLCCGFLAPRIWIGALRCFVRVLPCNDPLQRHILAFARTEPYKRVMRIAIAGMGGLGHLGVQFAVALGKQTRYGVECMVLSGTPGKRKDAPLVFGSVTNTNAVAPNLSGAQECV
jgi:hypothetical protein